MPLETILIILGAYLAAGLVKGATGLGFSTTCLPLLALAVGLKDALPLVIIPSVSSNVLIIRAAGHFRETLNRFRWLYLALLPGLALGLSVLSYADGRTAAAVLGIVLILYGVYALLRPPTSLSQLSGRRLAPLVGFLTGAVNGLTGSQVMPLLPYALALGLDPNRFVQAVNISFTISSLVMAVGLSRLSLLDMTDVYVSAAGIAPALLGAWFGNRLRTRLKDESFRKAVLMVLVALGVVLIWKALAF